MLFEDVRSKVVAATESYCSEQFRKGIPETGNLSNRVSRGAPSFEPSTVNLVRLEKMKMPSFSGNIRCYARFKKDFREIVTLFYMDPIHQIYVIKESCLKLLVENIEDIEALWKRLDDKYGDKIDLVDIVIKDLKSLPYMKINDDPKFVQMVDTLEKGLVDLETIGAREEIANAYTVKIIESKISRQLYLTWLKEEEKDEIVDEEERSQAKPSRFEKLFS